VSGEPLAQLHGAATVEAALAGLALLDPQLAARLEAGDWREHDRASAARPTWPAYAIFARVSERVLFDQARQLARLRL